MLPPQRVPCPVERITKVDARDIVRVDVDVPQALRVVLVWTVFVSVAVERRSVIPTSLVLNAVMQNLAPNLDFA